MTYEELYAKFIGWINSLTQGDYMYNVQVEDTTFHVEAASVPEPATIALMLYGLMVIIALRLIFNRKKAK